MPIRSCPNSEGSCFLPIRKGAKSNRPCFANPEGSFFDNPEGSWLLPIGMGPVLPNRKGL